MTLLHLVESHRHAQLLSPKNQPHAAKVGIDYSGECIGVETLAEDQECNLVEPSWRHRGIHVPSDHLRGPPGMWVAPRA